MSNMQVFSYNDNEPKKLRVIVVESTPWLILSDLNKILGMSNTTQLARALPKSERRYAWLCEPRSRLEYIVINEDGLQTILKRYASKPGIDRVVRWIWQDVLPHITRKGGFPASILHKDYEAAKTRRNPSTKQRVDSAPAKREENFVVPVTKVIETKPVDEFELFDLWELEMFLRIAKMEGLTEKMRLWAVNSALREVRKRKPLDSSDPALLKLPEVAGHVTQRRRHMLKQCDYVVLNPVTLIAKRIGVSLSKVDAFAEAKGMKRNGIDGFWVEVSASKGKAREFMYTDEAMELLIGEAVHIHGTAA